MTLEKQSNVLRRGSKGASASKLPRARRGGKNRTALRTRGIWRALAEAALSLPHTPVLRRLHD